MIDSRRKYLFSTGLIAFLGTSNCAIAAPEQKSYADIAVKDKWVDDWIESTKAVSGALHLGRFSDPTYFTTKAINWTPNPGQDSFKRVRVPAGFVTDLTSIPREFWSFLRPDGNYTYPAIIHDYLYWEQNVTKDQADLIFKYGMQDFKIDPITINTIIAAVKLGGQSAWNSNTKLKASGEKRIIKIYPEDPTISWAQWKIKLNIY